MITIANWWDAVEGIPIARIGRALGLRVTPARGAHGGALAPCPACSAERRHTTSRDKRAALGIRRDGLGARCFQCETGFGPFSLIAWAIGGKAWRDLGDADRARVRAWVEDFSGGAPARRPAPELAPAATTSYPPPDEVRALWDSCSPVELDPEIVSWLDGRSIDPVVVSGLDLARSIRGADLQSWARLGERSWLESGHRLIFSLVDPRARIRSVLARRVCGEGDAPKSIAPRGYTRAGLVLADRPACDVLYTGQLVTPTTECDGRVLVLEGEIDWLVSATQAELLPESDRLPASIGIFSGSWSEQIAQRIPSGSRVVLLADDDVAGEKYSRQVLASLAKRELSGALTVERWRA